MNLVDLPYRVKEITCLYLLTKMKDYKSMVVFQMLCDYKPCKYSDSKLRNAENIFRREMIRLRREDRRWFGLIVDHRHEWRWGNNDRLPTEIVADDWFERQMNGYYSSSLRSYHCQYNKTVSELACYYRLDFCKDRLPMIDSLSREKKFHKMIKTVWQSKTEKQRILQNAYRRFKMDLKKSPELMFCLVKVVLILATRICRCKFFNYQILDIMFSLYVQFASCHR